MFFHLNHFPSVYTIQTQFFPANRGRWSIFVDVNPQRDAAAQFRLLGKKKKKKRQHNVQHISPKCTYACNCISHILKNNVRFKAQLNYLCPGYLGYLQKPFLLKGIVLLRRLLIPIRDLYIIPIRDQKKQGHCMVNQILAGHL